MNLMRMLSEPNTPGPLKFVVAGVGAAAGLATAYGIERALVDPVRAEELRGDGMSVVDSRQAEVYAMAIPFGLAAGISLGIQRRSPTAGLTTTAQIASAALLSTVAGAVINADTPKAGDFVTGIGLMAATTGAGILIGVRDEVKLAPARMAGLALFGAALGVVLPTMARTLGDLPGAFQRGFEHRDS
jgi:hypothetical protein